MARKTVVALRQAGVEKMGYADRKNAEDKLQQIIDDLNGKQQEGEGSRPDLLQEKGRLLVERKRLEEKLNQDDDLKAVNSGERDRLLHREKELRERIKKNRLTPQQAALRSGSFDFEMAVKQTIYGEQHDGALKREWQQIKRRLEPDNSNADNIDLIDR